MYLIFHPKKSHLCLKFIPNKEVPNEGKVNKMDITKQPGEKHSYRLPTNSVPLSYEIIIKSNIHAEEFEFSGKVDIHVKIIQPTDTITLHQRDIEIEQINLVVIDSCKASLPYKLTTSHDFLTVILPRIFNPHEELKLSITYHGELNQNPSGFYCGSYKADENSNPVWYAATKFQINNARNAIPCYDEPGIRAPIRLTVVHSRNFFALSNMDVDEKLDFIDFSVTKFRQTPPMQMYLLAIVVSNFEYVSATDSRIPQRIFAKPSSIRNGEADFAAKIVGKILNAIEDHFQFEYPLAKLDHVGLMHFINGAMENFGIVHYAEPTLLLDPNDKDESSMMTIIRIVTHEMVHQFFGNTVSPKWWNYTWLSEGLATLYEIFIADQAFPEYKFMNRFVAINMPVAFREDSDSAWPMSHYSEKPNELKKYFNKIGFEKAACVLRMYQEAITPKTFSKGLNIYLMNSFMKSVEPKDLHIGLQRAYNQEFFLKPLNIAKSMVTWENQNGYPILSVRVFGTNLIISQTTKSGVFSVPVTLATKSNPDFNQKRPKVWLNTTSMAVANVSIDFNENEWIILNIQQVGYYRVDYETKLWHAIINQLIENSSLIHAINRAVLQDEILLAWKEFRRISAYECLDILSYLSKENEPMAWSKAQNLMQIFNDRLFGTCVYYKFLEFLQSITNPHVVKHGFESRKTDSPRIKSLRMLVKAWNCYVLGRNCLEHERIKLKKYLDSNEIFSVDFCAAIRNVDEETYQSLTEAVAMKSKFVNRINFLNSLGCSLNRSNLKKFLKISINCDNILTEDERVNVIKTTMGRSIAGLDVTIDFIIENSEDICQRYGDLKIKHSVIRYLIIIFFK